MKRVKYFQINNKKKKLCSF